MKNLQLYILSIALIAIGLGVASYKHFSLGFPLSPNVESHVWNIEAKVEFRASGKSAKATVYIPLSSKYLAIMDENFVSPGYGTTLAVEGPNRRVVWSIRKADGKQVLYFKAIVRELESDDHLITAKPPEIQPVDLDGAARQAADTILSEVKNRSSDSESLISELMAALDPKNSDERTRALMGKKPSSLIKMQTAVKILTLSGLPARVVHGIRLQDGVSKPTFFHWLEVYEGKGWKPFDPMLRKFGMPSDYLTWWKGDDVIGSVQGGEKLNVSVSVSKNIEESIKSALQVSEFSRPLLASVSLFDLPIESQSVYRILLLIPVGAFVVVLIRSVIGLTTFGTFMPVLIALAFRETELAYGILFFLIIVVFGLMARFYLERLKLLLIPRLASVLIVVVILMAVISIVTHKFGTEKGLSVALFPMIIMTMAIERMSILWEELGVWKTLQQTFTTLLSASIVYLVITNKELEHLIFVFPELLLVILAINLLLGRYTGYRLLELYRFRSVG